MLIPTRFDKCIICLENTIEGLEHILPECIGGRLQSNLLCKSCNNKFGSEIISKIKIDPTFRLAIEALESKLPNISKAYLEKAVYVGSSTDGSSIRLTRQRERLKVIPYDDISRGILELDNEDAEKYLIKHLKRASVPEGSIRNLINSFNDLENFEQLLIPTGIKLQKIPIGKIYPELLNEHVDPRFWVIMAYEFLSLVIGKAIYNSFFEKIRDYMITGKNIPGIEIGSFQGSKEYETNHVLGVVPKEDRIIMYIKLFGWIYQRVSFLNITGKIMDIVYFEDLSKNQSLIALNREDAKNGIWYEFL